MLKEERQSLILETLRSQGKVLALAVLEMPIPAPANWRELLKPPAGPVE